MYNRYRKEYSAYVSLVKNSGRKGDDKSLYEKPQSYELVQELDRENTRDEPPAMDSTDLMAEGANVRNSITSTRKRAKHEKEITLQAHYKLNATEHDDISAEAHLGNEHCATFNNMFKRLIEKL